MVTKLRRFSRNIYVKYIAFTLAVLAITISILEVNYIFNRNLESEAVFVKEYTNSLAYRSDELVSAYHEIINQIANDNAEIMTKQNYLYYVSDGENVYQNATLDEIMENDKYLYKFIDRTWEYGEKTLKNIEFHLNEDYTFYLTFSEEYMAEKQQEWQQTGDELRPIIISMIVLVVVAILCIIYLIVVTGRGTDDDEVHLTPYMDKIYSDIQLIIMASVLFIWLAGEMNLLSNSYYNNKGFMGIEEIVHLILVAIMTAIATIICGVILLSMVRKVKAGKLFKHSLIYAIFAGFSNFIRSFFNDSRFEHFPLTKSLNRRQVIFTVVSGFLVFLTFLFTIQESMLLLLPIFVEIVVIYWYFYENNKTFIEINQGFNESLQEQMKSERMKVDLITNVSHDLKTPLTSIISYVDLLSKEDLPESAQDYVNILADKSYRLKNIVSDLFDLAKSTSGNLPLNMENIDLKKLIEQTLGDMEDEIEKAGNNFKINLPEQPVYIFSDGNKLYRVFQNIIGNALKYSLEGTRVFIDMEIDNNIVSVIVKNTASYEMDFTADEVVQRFNRGDKSRTTEGSGLGLSIAESYTWACGGRFAIKIDGDQFKVKLGFKLNII
ncbi:MAG: HAMP domain-containing histidine kinase [Clostridiales bacterium]|nr:HAMP domain-containing histidine kinase [Clostridiales bacterium]